jgi:hypothetical protein
MTTLTELCNDVYTVTKRPDLIAETKLAVKAATLKLHQSDFYFRDIFETGIQFDTSDYTQQLNITTVIPRYRALKYLRRYDSSGSGAAAEFFDILSPKEILDDYGLERVGVAYAAGTVLNLKSRVPIQFALLGVYVNPDVTDSGYDSWLANNHPFAIVHEAARVLFKQIGFDEQSTAFERLALEQLALVKSANIQAEGY